MTHAKITEIDYTDGSKLYNLANGTMVYEAPIEIFSPELDRYLNLKDAKFFYRNKDLHDKLEKKLIPKEIEKVKKI